MDVRTGVKLTDWCPYANPESCPIWREALMELGPEPCGEDPECLEILERERAENPIICPKCGVKLKHFLRADVDLNVVNVRDEYVDFHDCVETLYYECPECGAKFAESPWGVEP